MRTCVKLAAGAALGLDIDYYMQVNLAGFRQIIDAVGGITVNVNYRVPIGGDYGDGPGSNSAKKPSGYIEPGPNQKLDGYHALWFARGRYGLSDPSRQERQRCTIHALVNSVNPATLVTKYQQIASAGKQVLRTDIPQEILPAFIQLGLKVKGAKVTNVDLDKNKNFPTGKNPDYTAMQEIIQKAIAPKTAAGLHPVDHHDEEAVQRVDQEGDAEAGRDARRHREPERRLRVQPQPDRELTATGPTAARRVRRPLIGGPTRRPGEPAGTANGILVRCVRRTGCGRGGSSGCWPPG